MFPWFIVALILAAIAAYVHLATEALVRRRPPDADDPPDRYGLAYEDVVLSSADGLRLRGWFVPAVDASGPRDTIILCHGQSGSMNRDTNQAPFLHDAGFNVLMFDFRGHGRSEGNLVSMGYFERLDLLAAVAYLEERGLERIGVLGWSMGGAIAMAVAPQAAGISAVVSDSGYASLQRVLAGGLGGRGVPLVLARPLSWLMLRYASLRAGVDLAAAEPRRQVGPDFRCPLLLIQGGRDPYVPLRDVEVLARASGGPVELWQVPDASHRCARELHPDEYQRRVTAFFSRWLRET